MKWINRAAKAQGFGWWLHFRSQPDPDKESQWLPAATRGPFNLTVLDGPWKSPAVKLEQ